MSGVSSTRTIIESFARPSPLIRESVSIASSPAKSNFVNRGDPPRSISTIFRLLYLSLPILFHFRSQLSPLETIPNS